uniref:Uncharacterized protein n=1 Tax=Glossina austeni TaxID=7395 RepID=A0A1A9UXP7_GLOAU
MTQVEKVVDMLLSSEQLCRIKPIVADRCAKMGRDARADKHSVCIVSIFCPFNTKFASLKLVARFTCTSNCENLLEGTNTCKYLNWRAAGESPITSDASLRAREAFCSPSAAITLALASRAASASAAMARCNCTDVADVNSRMVPIGKEGDFGQLCYSDTWRQKL